MKFLWGLLAGILLATVVVLCWYGVLDWVTVLACAVVGGIAFLVGVGLSAPRWPGW